MSTAIRGDDIWTEQGTQAEGYNIKRVQLFDMPTAASMVVYNNADDDQETKPEDDADANPER
jgi:hypothetical protein